MREGKSIDARHAGGNLDAFKTRAIIEGIIADARHANGDLDAFKTRAVVEGSFADARHAIADDDFCDILAIAMPRPIRTGIVLHGSRTKNVQGLGVVFVCIIDISTPFAIEAHDVILVETHLRCIRLVGIHAVLGHVYLAAAGIVLEHSVAVGVQLGGIDGDRGQFRAIPEGLVIDGRHTGGDLDAGQTSAAIEGTIAYARHAIRDGDAIQTGAVTKGIEADASHAIRDGDAIQTGAAIEGSFADARHAIGDGDAFKTGAAIEGIIAYGRHAIADDDGLDRHAIAKPRAISGRIVRHGSRTKNVQGRGVAVVGIIDIVAAGAVEALYLGGIARPASGSLVRRC